MAVAKPRQATFFAGCVVPRFCASRVPPKNALAAVAAKAIPDTPGLPALLFLFNNQSAVAPNAFAAVPA